MNDTSRSFCQLIVPLVASRLPCCTCNQFVNCVCCPNAQATHDLAQQELLGRPRALQYVLSFGTKAVDEGRPTCVMLVRVPERNKESKKRYSVWEHHLAATVCSHHDAQRKKKQKKAEKKAADYVFVELDTRVFDKPQKEEIRLDEPWQRSLQAMLPLHLAWTHVASRMDWLQRIWFLYPFEQNNKDGGSETTWCVFALDRACVQSYVNMQLTKLTLQRTLTIYRNTTDDTKQRSTADIKDVKLPLFVFHASMMSLDSVSQTLVSRSSIADQTRMHAIGSLCMQLITQHSSLLSSGQFAQLQPFGRGCLLIHTTYSKAQQRLREQSVLGQMTTSHVVFSPFGNWLALWTRQQQNICAREEQRQRFRTPGDDLVVDLSGAAFADITKEEEEQETKEPERLLWVTRSMLMPWLLPILCQYNQQRMGVFVCVIELDEPDVLVSDTASSAEQPSPRQVALWIQSMIPSQADRLEQLKRVACAQHHVEYAVERPVIQTKPNRLSMGELTKTCCNPICNNNEVHLGVTFSRCGQCRLVKYCSPACQRQHWPMHQEWCKPPM